MVLHINLRDSAPPFKGGDSVFDSGVSFICGSGEMEDTTDLKSVEVNSVLVPVRVRSPAPEQFR